MRTSISRAAMAAGLVMLAGLLAGAAAPAVLRAVDEMDRYVAKRVAEDTAVLKAVKWRELWVASDGKPDNPGTKDAPVDFAAAFTSATLSTPGTIVWIGAGRYEVGDLAQGDGVRGLPDQPVIYRAAPGARATIVGQLRLKGSHTWLWGLEITGPPASGVWTVSGDGLKVINCIIHDKGPAEKPDHRYPSGQGIGGWDVGNDHEFYGNVIYHNGWFTLDHGIYSQNTAKHTVKRYVDNIVFENAGFGLHLYGSSPVLSGFDIEGNICFATSLMPRNPNPGQVNILVGGSKPLSNVVLRANCTYHPQANSKRGVDIGYSGSPNRNILVEDNYFMCGSDALLLKGVANAVVRNNTFWAPNGMVSVSFAPPAKLQAEAAASTNYPTIEQEAAGTVGAAAPPKAKARPEPWVDFEHNTYIDNGKFNLDAFRARIKSGETDTLVPGKDGRPTGTFVFKRVNRYDPTRVHVAVYNWSHAERIPLDLADVLKPGQAYRLVEVHDVWGKPALEGRCDGKPLSLMVSGPYAPEFGCYLLVIGDRL